MATATFRQRLASGDTLFGPFVILNSPDLVEIIGNAGWDFALLDCEHGPYGPESLADLARACRSAAIHPVVRVPSNDEWLINKALDVGAEAVLVPQIDGLESARRAVAAAKYAPEGHRGANPFTRAAEFGARGGPEYYGRANRETMLILGVEGVEGAAAFGEMAKLEGADGFFIGPVDLSHSLGLPGQPDHPQVQEKIREMISIARDHGKPVGVFATTPERAKSWVDAGAGFIPYQVDSAIVFRAFQSTMRELKG